MASTLPLATITWRPQFDPNLWPLDTIPPEYRRRLPVGKLPKDCGRTVRKRNQTIDVECTSTVAAGVDPRSCPERGPASACAARVAPWEPEQWANEEATGSMPWVPPREVRAACDSIRVRVARSDWRQLIATNRSIWQPKYALAGPPDPFTERTEAQKARCLAQLQSFRPRVCSLRNVFVWGSRRRMYGTQGFYLPPEAQSDPLTNAPIRHGKDRTLKATNFSSEGLCAEATATIACGGHAVLARNTIGVAYHHLMVDVLPSIAFAAEFLAARPNVSLLENLCIPAEGYASTITDPWDHRLRFCLYRGQTPFVTALLSMLGLSPEQSMHYPYARQRVGPSVYLDKATFDCSEGYYGNYWHLLKLRSLFLSLPIGPPNRARSLLVINRNNCLQQTARKGAGHRAQEGTCHSGREVRSHAAILDALRAQFPNREVIDAKGDGSLLEQAAQFRRSALVAGPYGAGMNNMIFCPSHTAVVEFVATHRRNLFVFGAYAHVYGLAYWVILSTANDYSGVSPADVVETAQLALSSDQGHVVEFNSDYLRDGYGRYTPADNATAFTRVGW